MSSNPGCPYCSNRSTVAQDEYEAVAVDWPEDGALTLTEWECRACQRHFFIPR